MQAIENHDPLLATPTVAGLLSVQEVTLEKWRQNGCGPAYVKVGRLVRYRQSEIARWLQERTVTAS